MENTSNDYNRMIMNLNSECVDCGTLNPTYASVNNGVTTVKSFSHEIVL